MPPPRIDAHQHFWRYDPQRYDWIMPEMDILRRDFLPEHLRPDLFEAGIDACIAVQAESSENETRFLLDLAQANPEIAAVVGWLDLRAQNIAARLDCFSRFPKLRGLRHIAQSEPDDEFLIREPFLNGIARLEAFDLAYDILIYPRQLHAAAELVRRFPRQRFIIDHLAKPAIRAREIEPWAGWMRKIARHENVFCKLSGLVTEADWNNWTGADFTPYLDVVFEAFGVDRLIFGSDWPVCLLAATYSQVTSLIASYAASGHDRVFGQNAALFYGLATD